MAIVTDYLTNTAYGYPTRGAERRITPIALACIHITGNSNNLGTDAAQNERNYANRDNSGGPSAHYYLNRDGSGVEAIDHVKYAAWSNGVINNPNTTNAGVRAILELKSKGYNPNECFWLEIEDVGYSTTFPVTGEQVVTIADLIAREALRTGLPITRDTVLTHADLDSVNRVNCAFTPTFRETRLDDIIATADNRLQLLLVEQDLNAQIAKWISELNKANTTISDLTTSLNALTASFDELNKKYIDLSSSFEALTKLLEDAKVSWKRVNEILGQ